VDGGAESSAAASALTASRKGPFGRILPVYGVVGISYFGYAMMGTLFVPMLLADDSPYVASGTSRAARSIIIGVLLMLYPLAQVVGSPILGALSDRFGRRPILLVSLAITTAAYAVVVLALAVHSLWLLGAALFVCGLGEANAAIASSVIADVTNETERPKYLGYMFSTASVSYVLGPAIGGALATSFGYAVPFAAVLLLLALALIAVRWRYRETHAPQPGTEATSITASFSNLRTVFTDKPLRWLYGVNFLVFVAAMGFWRVITEYLVDVFHLTVGQVTMDYAVFAVTAALANFVVMPRLVGRIEMRNLGIVAAGIGAASMALAVLPGSVWIAIGFGALASMAMSLTFPALSGMLSSMVGPERQGAVLGNNTALTFLGEAIGVLGGSALAGFEPALPLLIFAAFAAGAAVLLLLRR
jgi:MFS transporter, DHA1 family, tetracycline resistance protein